MPARNNLTVWKIVLTLSALLLWVDCAMAYVGPGAGLELIPYFVGLLVWVGTAFLAFLLYPIYSLLRFFRGGKASPSVTEPGASEQPGADQPAPLSGQQNGQVANGEQGIMAKDTRLTQ